MAENKSDKLNYTLLLCIYFCKQKVYTQKKVEIAYISLTTFTSNKLWRFSLLRTFLKSTQKLVKKHRDEIENFVLTSLNILSNTQK